MYCPKCGNQNFENAKYCRACGSDLETVSLAVNNKLAAPSNWLEKYGEGKSKVAGSAIMIGGSFLIWLVPGLFIKDIVGWTAIWAVFFGWLAVWGIISLAANVGSMVKARTMLRAADLYNDELNAGQRPGLSQTPDNYQLPNSRYATDQLQSPPSVTEHTTKFLNKK
jgi:hypothetical protein